MFCRTSIGIVYLHEKYYFFGLQLIAKKFEKKKKKQLDFIR